MNRYSYRSGMTELIDDPSVPFEDWEVCLKELNTINTLLGGHSITLKGINHFIRSSNDKLTIVEIGCGGGDNLKAIHKWNRGRHNIKYIGVDLNQACIEFAKKNCVDLPASFITSDYRTALFDAKPDIIFSSLFCHHFSDQHLASMLSWLKKNSSRGFFINDLQRHPLAFHSISLLTHGFSDSYLVKNDAPISVLRGFKKKEWEQLFITAGIKNYSIEWKWAFRYLIIASNE